MAVTILNAPAGRPARTACFAGMALSRISFRSNGLFVDITGTRR